MKKEQIDQFIKISVQLSRLHKELSELSKKNPNDGLNKFKLSLVNQLLKDANQILGEENKPIAGFDTFSEDEVPTNSDVVIVLGQYGECLEKFRCDHIGRSGGLWYWIGESGKLTRIETYSPNIKSSNPSARQSRVLEPFEKEEDFE